MDSESLSRQIVEIARGLEHETGAQATMDLTVRLAVDTVPHAQHAAITIARRGQGPQTQAATSALIHRIDEIRARTQRRSLRVGDLRPGTHLGAGPSRRNTLGRMGRTGPAGGRHRLHALLSALHHGTTGWSSEPVCCCPSRLNRDNIEAGTLVAAHAAIAIAMAQQLEHVEVGLDSRSTVGQAQGILMERYDIDAIRAFAVLRRISSRANRKLIDVASELVRTRDLPEAD